MIMISVIFFSFALKITYDFCRAFGDRFVELSYICTHLKTRRRGFENSNPVRIFVIPQSSGTNWWHRSPPIAGQLGNYSAILCGGKLIFTAAHTHMHTHYTV